MDGLAGWRRTRRPGAVQGSQHCAHDYQKLLKQFGMIPSTSRTGNRWDNAPMGSFRGTLKTERVHHRRFATRGQARQEITKYIEIFYNRMRRQARLRFPAPAKCIHNYDAKQITA